MILYDSLQQQCLDFSPPNHTVGIYTCGITPYDSAHLGHIFTFMTYDLLQRILEDQGHEVKLVRNITDVDEPIYIKAKELGIDYRELAKRETASFQDTLRKLHFRKPYAEPKASAYIEQMAEAISHLLRKGFAYQLANDIYFDVARFPAFGELSHFDERLKLAFMKRRGGDPARPGKRQPLDFLLWHGVVDPYDPAAWATTVGRGRPGWHIECSVMSAELLGETFDLHGGGNDLLFPHHDSEIAQSYGLHGKVPARHWLHVAALSYEGEKMSKSLGNLVFAHDLLHTYDANTIRLALMHYHYRVGGEWLPELLDKAAQCLQLLRTQFRHASLRASEQLLKEVREAMMNDLDTHAINHALHVFIVNNKRADPGDNSGASLLARTFDLLGFEVSV